MEKLIASHACRVNGEVGEGGAFTRRGNSRLSSADPESAFRDAVWYLERWRYDEAQPLLQKILVEFPDHGGAMEAMALVAHSQGDYATAEGLIRRLIEVAPGRLDLRIRLAEAEFELGRDDAALARIDEVLGFDPEFRQAIFLRGRIRWRQGQAKAALRDFDEASVGRTDIEAAVEGWSLRRLMACDWRGYEVLTQHFVAQARAGRDTCQPFIMMMFAEHSADISRAARTRSARRSPARAPLYLGQPRREGKIRIGYVSSDFQDHPVAHLLAGVLESHDRERFEIFGYSIGLTSDHEVGRRIRAACDSFHDMSQTYDLDVAKAIREHDIDIAISLGGHTAGSRLDIFSHRPAAVQVNYQGYPGTIGAPYVDYLIADRFTVSPEETGFYDEKIVWMPHTYQPTSYRDEPPRPGPPPSRASEGLPDKGFVFLAFNGSSKITPAVFDVWMEVLRAVEGSVIWLSAVKAEAQANLIAEAKARGVQPDRLVFAVWSDRDHHLARQPLADLFLDTRPYNAHSTASDALWAGVPIITCPGETFASRVCAGLLRVAGLDDLVVPDMAAYRDMAIELAGDPDRLARLRRRVEQARSSPLFDTAAYTRNLERAFAEMHRRRMAGLSPEAFAVDDL